MPLCRVSPCRSPFRTKQSAAYRVNYRDGSKSGFARFVACRPLSPLRGALRNVR